MPWIIWILVGVYCAISRYACEKVTPTGSTGRIFGFVYSGLDFGSSLMPLLLGLIMDIGSGNYVFYACAVMLFLTIFTVVNVKKRSSTAF